LHDASIRLFFRFFLFFLFHFSLGYKKIAVFTNSSTIHSTYKQTINIDNERDTDLPPRVLQRNHGQKLSSLFEHSRSPIHLISRVGGVIVPQLVGVHVQQLLHHGEAHDYLLEQL